MSYDLQAESLRRFDQLVAEGQIIFQDAPPMIVPAKPFNFQFRIANSLTKKPQIEVAAARALQRAVQTPVSGATQAQSQGSDDTVKDKYKQAASAKLAGQPVSPFDRDPPSFVLDNPTPHHTLRLNKYCVVRPQFVLHTNVFQSQLEPLQPIDFAAGWDVLKRLGDGYMLIFNGGTHGGWSIPHRHMQLLPVTTGEVEGFELFPDSCGIGQDGKSPGVPYDHAVRALNPGSNDTSNINAEHLHALYTSLLSAANVDATIEYSHNLLLTHRWMLVIPRTQASQPGVKVINAAAMVGMTWVPSDEVWQAWQACGDKMGLLQRLGRPVGGS